MAGRFTPANEVNGRPEFTVWVSPNRTVMIVGRMGAVEVRLDPAVAEILAAEIMDAVRAGKALERLEIDRETAQQMVDAARAGEKADA